MERPGGYRSRGPRFGWLPPSLPPWLPPGFMGTHWPPVTSTPLSTAPLEPPMGWHTPPALITPRAPREVMQYLVPGSEGV